jgi:hypothetical protein
MQSTPPLPARLNCRLGFWFALSIAVLFLTFTVCFTAVAFSSPSCPWTSAADYITCARNSRSFFKDLAQFAMLLFGPLYLLLLNSIHQVTSPEHRVLTRAGLLFGSLFAALSSTFYFIQLTAVRFSVLHGESDGLAQIAQANPHSALLAANMLGWTLFFGLSSLLVAPVFTQGRLEKWIRILFMANGITCLLGAVAFALQNVLLINLLMNFLMGGLILAASITLCVYFRRMENRIGGYGF